MEIAINFQLLFSQIKSRSTSSPQKALFKSFKPFEKLDYANCSIAALSGNLQLAIWKLAISILLFPIDSEHLHSTGQNRTIDGAQ